MPARTGLGEFEMLVLGAVLRLGEGAYGAAIRREIERTGRAVTMSAVYTTIGRLESRGLVTARMGDPTPVRGGRRRKLYRMEAAGHAELREATTRLSDLLRGTDLELGIP